jgi:hypothetical protein
MELKGRAVQPTDKTPWHKNACGEITTKFKVRTAVLLKIEVFWVAAARRLLNRYRRFDGS